MAGLDGTGGVTEQGTFTQRPSGTQETLPFPSTYSVPRIEGHEVKRDERQGVGTSRNTVEAGESNPFETPWRKGAVVVWNR